MAEKQGLMRKTADFLKNLDYGELAAESLPIAGEAAAIKRASDAFKEKEPVLLGQTSTDWLDDFISQFETVVKGLATLPPAPPAAVAKLIATGNSVLPLIPALKSLLKNLHSKKTFVE